MKGQILKLLRKETSGIAVERISSRLGISPVVVQNHIQELVASGYEIDMPAGTYRLVSSPGTPFAWEFPAREECIHYFDSIPSTMNIAREMAGRGCPEMTVVVADVQTRGRGRMNRLWQSEKGGLYFTLVLRPATTPQNSARINLYAATVLARTLRAAFDIEAGVKWPNDIFVGGKKVAGLLSEMASEADRVSYLNIGIGINVNNDPTSAEPNATTLKHLLGRPVSRVDLLAFFLDELKANLSEAVTDRVIDQWKQITVTLNRPVKVVTQRTVFEGVAVDIDDTGGLMIRQKDGSIKTVVYGDCFHGD